MKNKIALKLTLYFSAVLVVFALIIGGVFYQFFKEHTVDIKKQEMRVRAEKIADVLSDNMSRMEQRHGAGIANSKFITYLDNVTQDFVWVVDSERNLTVNKERMRRAHNPKTHHRSSFFGLGGMPEPQRFNGPPKTPKEAYNRMPSQVKAKVERCFQGQGFVLEEYNPMLDGIMLTVGQPVYGENGQIKAVLLLHSPVEGLREAVWEGLRILFVSLLVAAVLGMLLAVLFSWRFTKPLNVMKNVAEHLAERDYSARSNISQQDEIGELARTLDELAGRLQLADEESQKLEKLRREFIANISHELRTPVTVIRGSLEALRDGVVTEQEDVQEFHEQMYKESLFLQRLINDLLDLSRLQNTDFPIEKEPLNMVDVIHDAVRSSRQLGTEKRLQITSSVDEDCYMLNGDYGRLRQMLMVFLHNSIKFSPEGSELLLELEGNRLKIIDHGCGIKPEDVPHAFDRFYKARNEHNKSGSGLGLAIAKQIAQRHDMELELTSKVGEGTTITVVLPPKMKQEQE
ncbi:cell wall metabolism sensor histidine kinase WalK [uncultured Phascolarctobacterium sp.]|jgi:signal transduction histidine kinase|uniref:sensor histidine kinase n=1 Tax=uncultured Phascolarctobacterium sp. TaxID=512296 RepID=UPI0025EFC80F|nr:HAMP domain-containing sensor histidine kinase [uncultured Phascolarctobacterium sp.]